MNYTDEQVLTLVQFPDSDDYMALALALESLLADRQRLQAVAKALRTDTERLDWLDNQYESYGFENYHEGNRWILEGPFNTVREAIDAGLTNTETKEAKP